MKTKVIKKIPTIIACLALIIGVCMLAYPTIADAVNSFTQSRAIAGYTQAVESMDSNASRAALDEARAYNAGLIGNAHRFSPTEEEQDKYSSLLDITGTGVMGYIEIPAIDVRMPIYHGTSDAVLQVGIGHMVGSSLPVGGEGTHSVLSGHSGLVSARILTDLEKVKMGDTFTIHVLDEILTYRVDQIKTVLPEEINDLEIVQGEDYVTVVTCTPYGVNSHRLLVRGERIPTPETPEETEPIPEYRTFDMAWMLIAILAVIAVAVVIAIITRKKRK